MNGEENTMTLHIQMLYEVAKSAKAMADAIQAIVDDCAEQLALRKVAGETDDRCSMKSSVSPRLRMP